jgi:hypothetical protein
MMNRLWWGLLVWCSVDVVKNVGVLMKEMHGRQVNPEMSGSMECLLGVLGFARVYFQDLAGMGCLW